MAAQFFEINSQNGRIYTIGYGQRRLDEIISILVSYSIKYLIDVRSFPYSKYNSEYNKDNLSERLRKHKIKYVFLGSELGGRPKDPEMYDEGKVIYERVSNSDFFINGMSRLINSAKINSSVAIICAEELPEQCHRSKLIGVELEKSGVEVIHILNETECRTQSEVVKLLKAAQYDLFIDNKFTSNKIYSK